MTPNVQRHSARSRDLTIQTKAPQEVLWVERNYILPMHHTWATVSTLAEKAFNIGRGDLFQMKTQKAS